MSLENVKVNDQVWWCDIYKPGFLLDIVVGVTAKKFRVRHYNGLIDKHTGAPYRGAQHYYLRVALPDEIEAWEAEQAVEG